MVNTYNDIGVVTFSLTANRNAASLLDSTPSEKLRVHVPLVTMLHISLRTTLSCLVGVATTDEGKTTGGIHSETGTHFV